MQEVERLDHKGRKLKHSKRNFKIIQLLKLSWKLRREFYLNINIAVGKRGQVPFAVLEIEPESDKGKRPRPDTSVVNNYLN